MSVLRLMGSRFDWLVRESRSDIARPSERHSIIGRYPYLPSRQTFARATMEASFDIFLSESVMLCGHQQVKVRSELGITQWAHGQEVSHPFRSRQCVHASSIFSSYWRNKKFDREGQAGLLPLRKDREAEARVIAASAHKKCSTLAP